MRRAWAVALLVTLAAGCADERERPLPTGPTTPAQLSVELIAPSRDQTVVAGSALEITIRAREPGGLLAGIGYYLHRTGPGRPLVDSGFVALEAASDTAVAFDFLAPDTLPNNAQLELVGFATGAAAERVITNPRGIIIIHCPVGAAFC